MYLGVTLDQVSERLKAMEQQMKEVKEALQYLSYKEGNHDLQLELLRAGVVRLAQLQLPDILKPAEEKEPLAE